MSALSLNVNKHILPNGFFHTLMYSRLVNIIMQIFFNHVMPDHISDGFQTPYKLIPINSTLLDSVVDFTFSGYARWDGQYFLHIATLGYTHENCLAFFPGYPFLLSVVSLFISSLSLGSLNWWNSLLLSSILLNISFFCLAGRYLYFITLKLFKNSHFALKTCKVFCISPATIFFLAPYSESLFSALTFGGVYYCTEYKFFKASVFFALSGATRSNGLVNIGFLVYFAVKAMVKTKPRNVFNLFGETLFSIIVAFFPFLCYQYYAYWLFCLRHSHADLPLIIQNYLLQHKLNTPGKEVPSWCKKEIPFSYSSVQSQYWDVGLLRYFTWNQVPNFLLASPILILVLLYSLCYLEQNIPAVFHAQGSSNRLHVIFQQDVTVFVAHSIFLSFFTFFFAHVQILTRLIGSSSPVVYWMIALIEDGKEAIGLQSKRKDNRNPDFTWNPLNEISSSGRWTSIYCLSYIVIGTAMFVNNLPWT